jgi:acetyl esterase
VPASTALPVLVFFHGGGWVIGDLDSHDVVCRQLADAGALFVIAIDYRRAPEHKFPAAVDDSYAATRWVADHAAELGVDASKIAVGGASAGGNLATVVGLMGIEESGPALVFQLLIYPVTDAALDTPSARAVTSDEYPLTRADMEWFWRHYLRGDADRRHPYASPALAKSLAGLPPALVITAEIDPLCDEGERYAAALERAGVAAACTRYGGVTHGFVGMEALLDKGRAAVAESAAALRSAFISPSPQRGRGQGEGANRTCVSGHRSVFGRA